MAAPVCAPYDIVRGTMTDRLAQVKIFTAETSAGLIVEIYADEAGRWAIVGTTPDMQSCLLDGGEYHELTPLPVGEAG